MVYISSFMYCDSIQSEITPQGQRINISNPLQVLAPIAIPSNYSFSVVCNFAGFDSNIDNNMRMQFVSPSGQIIYDTDNVSFKLPEEQIQSGRPAAMQFNIDVRNLVFMEIVYHNFCRLSSA